MTLPNAKGLKQDGLGYRNPDPESQRRITYNPLQQAETSNSDLITKLVNMATDYAHKSGVNQGKCDEYEQQLIATRHQIDMLQQQNRALVQELKDAQQKVLSLSYELDSQGVDK